MEHPVKTAPCPLLFASQGGKFDRLGNPILQGSAVSRATIESTDLEDPILAPLLCDVAYDCGVCPLLHEWVEGERKQGWSVEWECWVCIKQDQPPPDVERRFPGFYQSGRPSGDDGEPDDRDDDRPPLTGCTSCGQPRSILQLVLRRPRR